MTTTAPRRRHRSTAAVPVHLYGLPRGAVTAATVAAALFALFILAPIVWLVINATKTQANVYQSFGFWFARPFRLWPNLKELFTKHVPVQDKSARDALQTFTGGKGDVLLSYENEAITAQQKGEKVDYVTPDQTILIENPVAVTTKAKPEAKQFLDYLWTPAAQTVFAKHGYRPVVESVAKNYTSQFPTPKTLFTIDDLGGWDKVMTDFFDPANGSVAKIEEAAGVSTAK